MNKTEFLEKLRQELSALPDHDATERINFYREIIDDKIEDGLSEEKIIEEIGSADEIAAQILSEYSLVENKKSSKNHRFSTAEIILLSLGSPIWISLLISAFAVILSLYASVWAVTVSLWAVFGAFIGSAFGGIVSGIIFTALGNVYSGPALVAAALVLAGLSVFLFYGCKATTKGVILATKRLYLWTKKTLNKKEVE